MTELVLGTASFLPGYGVSRANTNLSRMQATELIETALSCGIRRFDTAPAYGPAEEILGETLGLTGGYSVSTKVGFEACKDENSLKCSVERSLERLKVPRIDTLYIHDERVLFDKDANRLIENLERLRTNGIFRKLGVSVYTLDSMAEIRKRWPTVMVYQVPENICDRRLTESQKFQELLADNLEFVVRSVFLQGLLLMKPEQLPSRLQGATKAIQSLHQFARKNSISVLDLCLAYARSITWSHRILIGAMSPSQLREICGSKTPLPIMWGEEVQKIPNDLIDPRDWS